MPYTKVKRDGKVCVYRKGEDGGPTGDSLGCHDSEEAADRQIAAVLAGEGKALSLDQQLNAIRDAIYAAIRPRLELPAVSNPAEWWIREIYEGFAILDHGAEHYRVEYELHEDGTVTLGEPQAVEQDWKPAGEVKCLSAEAVKMGRVMAGRNIRRLLPAYQFIREALLDAGIDPDAIAGEEEAAKAAAALLNEDTVVYHGGAVKALGDGWIEGPLVVFSTADDPDLAGEFFDAQSDLGEATESDCYFEHGLDRVLGKKRMGTTGRMTLRKDEFAVWAKAQLDRSDAYEAFLYERAEKGKLGLSSGTLPHLVEREPRGKAIYIKRWPLGLDGSLTLTPCEPRARARAIPLKSYQPVPLPEVGAQEAGAPASPPAVEVDPALAAKTTTVVTGGTTMPDNEQAQNANTAPATGPSAALESALKALGEQTKAIMARLGLSESPAGYAITDEADRALQARPFKSVGEFLYAIAHPTGDQRLLPLKPADPDEGYNLVKAVGPDLVGELRPAVKAASGMNETVPSQGGFLVGLTTAAGLLERTYAVGQLLQRVAMDPIGENSNGMTYHAIDETSRACGSRMGGVRFYWAAEANEKTTSKPKFRDLELKLKKAIAACYATDELLQDATALNSWIMRAFPQEVSFGIEDAIFRGTGAGMPLGITTSGALVSVAKEAGQAADTIVAQNVIKMWARCWAPSRQNAVWLYNQECEPQLYTLNVPSGTAGQLVFMPAGGLSGAPYATLFGRPMLPVEYAAALGDLGDIVLADLSQYQMISKGGLQTASSIHVRFLYDETCFRFVYRIDGQPAWDAPLTPYKGAGTLSPFVALAARA